MATADGQQGVRLMTLVMAVGGLAMSVVGAVLWFANADAASGDDSLRTLGMVLCILGGVELVASVTFAQVIRRRARPAGYDGQPVTYQDGARPPGML